MAELPAQLPTDWLCLAVALFLVKHLLADFFFQTNWMALGKQQVSGWILPLSVHTAIHALGTLLICLALAPPLTWFAAVDFVVHFLLDRAKALLSRRYAATPSEPVFWWLLGTDQALHGLTHFIFALWIAAAHVAAAS